MRAVDLTHVIREGMPVYPGTAPPTLTPASSLARDGYRETELSVWSHTGTHMDAPAHLLAEGAALDRIPLRRFAGPAALLDCRGAEHITAQRVRELPLGELEFVILRTGWEALFGKEAYYRDYPVLTHDAARLLADAGLSGVGVDAISLDPVDAPLENHRIVLGAGLVIVENLRNLDMLPERFLFTAMPLLYENADGAPVRAAAWI